MRPATPCGGRSSRRISSARPRHSATAPPGPAAGARRFAGRNRMASRAPIDRPSTGARKIGIVRVNARASRPARRCGRGGGPLHDRAPHRSASTASPRKTRHACHTGSPPTTHQAPPCGRSSADGSPWTRNDVRSPGLLTRARGWRGAMLHCDRDGARQRARGCKRNVSTPWSVSARTRRVCARGRCGLRA